MEIIIDGKVYEAYEKKEKPIDPKPGDFIVCITPAYGHWIVYKVLFSIIKNGKIVLVGENSIGNICVVDCTYKNFVKKYMFYNGQDGAHERDFYWWEKQQTV